MSTTTGGTIGKGLELLRALGAFPLGATAAEAAQRVRHPFSTTYRLLASLVDSGFVEYEPATKRYRVGMPVFELAASVAHARGLGGTALPVLEEVSAETGESVLLMMRDGDATLTLHKVDGPQFRTTTDPGDRGPLHSSAAGKALLAALPADERAEVVARLDLAQRTPSTVARPDALLTQLDGFAAQGWAVQDEEHDPGMRAIAVVIRQGDRPPSLVLALAAPVFRVDHDRILSFVPSLQAAADRLGLLLPAT